MPKGHSLSDTPFVRCLVLNFRWKKQTTRHRAPGEKKAWRAWFLSLADQGRGIMFLVEKKMSPNGQRRAEIYMRPDGLFEGRIYSLESASGRRQPGRRETE